ncbi:MAG: CinA family protein [Clostridiaceae bacterium]|jgi:PncC family amidohydrolase|nr:CinA family protein [Clostridiaceae bacterium]
MNISKLLTDNRLKITTAESCTGGLIAKILTDTCGASAYFDMGFVVYSNEAKVKLLGVDQQTLNTYGAVSLEVAKQMAIGALDVSGADVAISVTGIAGPSGGSLQKPVGLVFIGVSGLYGTKAERFMFRGTRDEIRQAAALEALLMASNYIELHYNNDH